MLLVRRSKPTIRAIYENGVFRPLEPVDLPDRCEVEFEPRLVNPAPDIATSASRAPFGTAEGRRKVSSASALSPATTTPPSGITSINRDAMPIDFLQPCKGEIG